MRYEIRDLGLGEILDQAIAVAKNHFGLLVGIAAILYLPLTLLTILVSYMVGAMTRSGEDMTVQTASMGGIVMMTILGLTNALIFVPWSQAAITRAVAAKYLNQPISIGEAIRSGAKRILPLIVAWICTWLLLMVGFLLLIIPGLYLMIKFSLVNQVAILEKTSGPSETLKRSYKLTTDFAGKIIVLGFVLFLINLLFGGAANLLPGDLLPALVGALIQTVLVVLSASVLVVLYFSARSHHEQFDLDLLAAEVQQADGPVPMLAT